MSIDDYSPRESKEKLIRELASLIADLQDYKTYEENPVSLGRINRQIESRRKLLEELLEEYLTIWKHESFSLPSDIRTTVNSFPQLASYLKEKFIVPDSENNTSTLRKILFLSANPINSVRTNFEQELREIQEQLERTTQGKFFSLKFFGAVRPQDFTARILQEKPFLLHFSGHGENTGQICLQDEQGKTLPIPLAVMTNLFKQISNHIKIQLVILNACYAEKQAETIADYVPFTIGMTNAIEASNARRFTLGFYQALGEGAEPENAFNLGCIQLGMYNTRSENMPVLFKNGQKVIL